MLKKNLEQREKPELIAIIQHMLRQEPELQWLLMTPLPTASSRKSSLDPEVYRQQVLAAMAAGESQRKRKRGEVERRLTAIKSIADDRTDVEGDLRTRSASEKASDRDSCQEQPANSSM